MLYNDAPTLTRAWVECPKPRPGASTRLVCLPHAGASPRNFFGWTDELPPEIELLAVCLPGRAGRADERLATSLREIVEPLARAINPLMTQDVVFFGHSLGALLAVELVLELRRRRLSMPRLLVASGRTVPGMGRTLKLHELPDHLLVREVQRIYGGIPRELLVEPEMLRRTLPILRADLSVNETYQHKHEPALDCPILALGGTDDPHVTRTELELWRGQTAGSFECAQFEGGHFYLTTREGTAWVIERTLDMLRRL